MRPTRRDLFAFDANSVWIGRIDVTTTLISHYGSHMNTRLLTACAAVSLAMVFGGAAYAGTETFTFSGPTDVGTFSGSAVLDVENGVAVSGSGSIGGTHLGTQSLDLITASTPGAEVASDGTFGYRSNGGDDFGGFDDIASSDLLFSLGPNATSPGSNVIFGIYDAGGGNYESGFFGNSSDGTRFYEYNTPGATLTAAVSAVPEPSVWIMMLGGIAMMGAALRFGRKRGIAALAA